MACSIPRVIGFVLRVIRAILGSLILFGVFLNFANVVGRYLFLRPIIWAEEILVFVMIWCVLLGAVLVSWEGRHLRMEVLYLLMPEKIKRWVNLVTTVAFLSIGVLVLVQSYAFVRLVAGMGQKSVVAEIPMVIPYSALPVSFALMVLAVAWRFRAFVRGQISANEVSDVLGDENREERRKGEEG